MFKNYQKGVSLYLALIIMFILIAIGLGVSLIIVSQMKMMKGMGDSVVAFCTADTGIEHSLYNWRKEDGEGVVSGSLGPDQDYTVSKCDPEDNCRESIGSFKIVKRGIEIMGGVAPTSELVFTITIDPTSGSMLACPFICGPSCGGACQTTATVQTTLISGSDYSITFSATSSYASFDPSGCDTINCTSIATFCSNVVGSYDINICGTASDPDSTQECKLYHLDVNPNPAGACPL